jgi:large subunit ribosomal protein LP1
MSSHDELACTYSALILTDDDVPITSEKITTILKAANVQFEPIWPTLFARAVTSINIKDFVTKIGAGFGTGAAPAAAAATEPAAGKKEEKKEEKKVVEEESDKEDEDMGFGLFD